MDGGPNYEMLHSSQQDDCPSQNLRLHIWHDHTSGWGDGATFWTVCEVDGQLWLRKRHIQGNTEQLEERVITYEAFNAALTRLIPVVTASEDGYPAFDAAYCGIQVRDADGELVERTWFDVPSANVDVLIKTVDEMVAFLDQCLEYD